MLNFDDLNKAMLKCEQSPGLNVYQHGQMVALFIQELIDHLKGLYGLQHKWVLPDWLETYKEDILTNHWGSIYEYARYHDCGKPFCRQVGPDGKAHFPDHAAISRHKYLEAGGFNNSVAQITIANLIGWDMVIHTAKSEEIENYCKNEWTVKDACTLLLASLAEIHANAKMFGGVDSTSFKIKYKQIDRRGKQICKFYFGEKP
jgi:hypothetical protein